MKLDDVQHRPWPMPSGTPAMFMRWEHLAFLHWRIDAELIRPLVPAGLRIDTFDGAAYLGVVPFIMSGVRHWRLPAIPGLRWFPELNLRTYVTDGEKPGVWFFSLDAANRPAVRAARFTFSLPYFDAAMSVEEGADGQVTYRSRRTHRGAPGAVVECSYRPSGAVYRAAPGSLDAFLTERYCLYSARASGVILRGEVHHAPWPLCPASASVRACTLPEASGLPGVSGEPIAHYVRSLDVAAWWPRRVGDRGDQAPT